jgi:hypothetical protein
MTTDTNDHHEPDDDTGTTEPAALADGDSVDDELGDAIDRLEVPAGDRKTKPHRAVLLAAAAAGVVAVVGAWLWLSSDDPALQPPAAEQPAATAVVGAGTTGELVEVDPDAANPRPAVIESVSRNGDTVDVTLFVDSCSTPASVEFAAPDGQLAVTVTVGDTAVAGEDCGDPKLVTVRSELDGNLARIDGDPAPAVDPGTTGAPDASD